MDSEITEAIVQDTSAACLRRWGRTVATTCAAAVALTAATWALAGPGAAALTACAALGALGALSAVAAGRRRTEETAVQRTVRMRLESLRPPAGS